MRKSRILAAAVGLALLAGGIAFFARRRVRGVTPKTVRENPFVALDVPHTTGPIRLDGELDEPDWKRAARTGAFRDARSDEARPYSEARVLWDEQHLYVALYAADEDIRASVTKHDGPIWIEDAFAMRFARPGTREPVFEIDVGPLGTVTDVREDARGRDPGWESGIAVAVDRDGTVGDPRDDDEEWVVEAAIPLAALESRGPGEAIVASFARCDRPRSGERRCGAWGGAAGGRLSLLAR